jgi:hypothetical protein
VTEAPIKPKRKAKKPVVEPESAEGRFIAGRKAERASNVHFLLQTSDNALALASSLPRGCKKRADQEAAAEALRQAAAAVSKGGA